ncbi:MAG: N-acetylmuramoyl-L-alanine amidase [Lachnospiraceae bacterium]|nr:N-acetylmuramoyl-L-alanine amidase [Lachnospiraceae bacterium]
MMKKSKRIISVIITAVLTVGLLPFTASVKAAAAGASAAPAQAVPVMVTDAMPYANYSMIKTGAAMLYMNSAPNANGITVCVNAGHGTRGGEKYKTLSHPDGTPKVTGGTTAAGSVKSTSISSGMSFSDGTSEASITLKEALILKQLLLNKGYNVLMIRESADVQLDNIARTVLANNYANCHIALHWDSTTSDKGAFYCKVANVPSYKAMEPVKSTWMKSDLLGECLVNGLRSAGRKIHGTGSMEMDLTQTSYSTIPSVDIELGDKLSDHSDAALTSIAQGLLTGVNSFFGIP